MKLNRVSIRNFKAIRQREELLGEGIIGLTGPNGHGKSTFANAIAWAFFGPDAVPTGKSDIVTWGQKEARVEVDFDIHGTEYSIVRWQKENGEGNTSLHRGDTELAKGLDPTPREVTALLGVDRVGFLISVFSRQEELAGLSSLTPANRMKTVLRLLGVEELTAAVETCRQDARSEKKVLESLRGNAADADRLNRDISRYEQAIIEGMHHRKETALLLSEKQKELKAAKEAITELAPAQRAWEAYQAALSAGKMRVAAAEGALGAAVRASAAPAPPNPGPEPPEPEPGLLDDLMGEAKFLQKDIKQLEEEAKSTLAFCPFCKRAYDTEDDIIVHRNEARVNSIRQRESLRRVESSIAIESNVVSNRMSWERRQTAWSMHQAGEAQRRAAVFAAHDTLRLIQSELNAITPVDDVRPDTAALRDVERGIADECAELRSNLAVLESEIRSSKQALSILLTDLEILTENATRIQTTEKRVVHLDIAARELSALKEKIIGKAIPSLNDVASRLIGEMTEREYNELSLTPDYEIQYRNDIGDLKGFDHLSGGEKDVFALALRLAIADLRADRIGVLFLDEVLESLDDERQNSVWVALTQLTRRYQQIFVVTHVDKFKDRAPVTLAF